MPTEKTDVPKQPEPWLRGTMPDVPAIPRAVLHALELANEDLKKWCGQLSENEMCAHPDGLPPVGSQIRHIARSIDRLLTYAEAHELSAAQFALLQSELGEPSTSAELFQELSTTLQQASARIMSLSRMDAEAPRTVGKQHLPTTLGGLLVHVADHTQRHVGQAITTTKFLLARRTSA